VKITPAETRGENRAEFRVGMAHDLVTVKAPCLVIHALNGSMFEKHGKYLADNLPNAKLVPLENIDHFPFRGADRIAAEVEEFLTGERSPATRERVLATLLFIDIVGSTRLAAEQGDHRWREVLKSYYGLARRHVERFRGIEVGTEGDGFFARFDGPARAVSCARAIRDGVEGLGLAVRAGLHTGEIEFIGEDVAGLAVHIAARVSAIASDGEVLVSRTVKDLVVGSKLEFTDRGVHELKGVPDTWQLYSLAG
jgi:class 3 adenylate cyclase